MSKDKRVVPDPKSGRDSSTQNPDAVKQYAELVREMDELERMNEHKALRRHMSLVRTAMGMLQQDASRERRRYGIVTEDLREALVASRNAYRELQRKVYAFLEVVNAVDEEEQ